MIALPAVIAFAHVAAQFENNVAIVTTVGPIATDPTPTELSIFAYYTFIRLKTHVTTAIRISCHYVGAIAIEAVHTVACNE